MLTRTFFARAPLAPGRFAPLPVGAVSAQGATRDRLLALRGGLLSRCASVFPEAGEQSAWFGGPLGGGMHAPELLEAMLLTGAQLGDEELRREALRLCGRVVERQREDGSFGAPGETFAARGRMLRALCAAYSMSGDKQFLTFMLRYMKYLHDTLRVCALSAEDAMHTADTLEAGVLLYNVTGQKAILSVLMLGFIYTFKAFDLMFVMTSGGPLNATDVLGTYSYTLSFKQYEFSLGSATVMVLFCCLFVIGLFYLRLISKEDE